MHGRMPVNWYCRGRANSRSRRAAFSLIEILIVVTIMAIVVGVVGSLMSAYMRMFNETDDQSAAKQRAIDVFNALELPIASVAMGIPTASMGGYFSVGATPPPIAAWAAPIDIRNTSDDSVYNTTQTEGDVLRLVYSVPTGVKHDLAATGSAGALNGRLRTFMAPHKGPSDPALPGEASDTLNLTGDFPSGMVLDANGDTRSFITGPDAYSSPLRVLSLGGGQAQVVGIPQRQAKPTSPDIIMYNRGEIPPFQDIHAVRAIAVYVDDENVFHAAEVNTVDVTEDNPAQATGEDALDAFRDAPGLRVEGIRAVRFETDDEHRLLTVRVLAEGEIVDETRLDSTVTRDALRARWPAVPLDDRIYYEDYAMTWRIRNYAIDG